jgi:hypothetical protein
MASKQTKMGQLPEARTAGPDTSSPASSPPVEGEGSEAAGGFESGLPAAVSPSPDLPGAGDEAGAPEQPLQTPENGSGEDEEGEEETQAILDSPQAFGIYIDYGHGQVLKRFNAGKTPLNKIEEAACLSHKYVADNGAEVIYRKRKKVKV